jgi:ubiquitin-like protein Nedd8
MLISIKTLSGRKLTLDVEPSQKVIEIKETLQEKEGIPKEQIRLIYSGKVINDEMKIEECNIQPGSNLMMALHLKGGC